MKEKNRTLSEHESKELLQNHGINFAEEIEAQDIDAAVEAAEQIGYPVVLKINGDAIAHKTERNLVRLGLPHAEAVRGAAEGLMNEISDEDGAVTLLVAEMVQGNRELIIGFSVDDQFGPLVLIGLGGILTEALNDVVFASAPVNLNQAKRMIHSLNSAHLIQEEFRGEPATDIDQLAQAIVDVSSFFQSNESIVSIDINPVIISEGQPIGVDALVEVGQPYDLNNNSPMPNTKQLKEKFDPLFNPNGIAVVGVSSHPGRFGSVALHNILRYGYQGKVFPVNRDGATVFGLQSYKDIDDIPDNQAELAFIATPPQHNEDILKKAHAKGVKAAFVAAGGYSEADEQGKKLEDQLVKTANKLNMTIAGPNGQGIISTASNLCAQIAAPYPPSGRISLVSQSGNVLSSLMNHAIRTNIGVNKAISAGNSAQTKITDYLNYFATDDSTDVVVAYLEGVDNGQEFINVINHFTSKKPLILIKGGIANEGIQAASSHTGSMATDNIVFQGICNQYGVIQAPSIGDGFVWAATFATQPMLKGDNVVIFTTAGGWGVLAADAISGTDLNLTDLPKEIIDSINELVPSRWSKSNPIDLAGGETRDTIPQVMDIVASHSNIDAIIHLGIGIQSAQAYAFQSGKFYDDKELELDRLVEFHQKQDERYALAAIESSKKYDIPILTATELVNSDRHYGNPGPTTIKKNGKVCYASAHRAVKALETLNQYRKYVQ
tara:strand:- start:7706 stop:9868 length:2163 start_codon:yes stop_codon:yes gene_type:complete